eukprot:3633711-Rhodomonas_salina.1
MSTPPPGRTGAVARSFPATASLSPHGEYEPERESHTTSSASRTSGGASLERRRAATASATTCLKSSVRS